MKKILLIFNGSASVNLLNFGCYMAGLTQARLIGVFHEVIEYERHPTELVEKEHSARTWIDADESHIRDERIISDIHRFQEVCDRKGIHATVHNATRFATPELVSESRFSDLIIMDATPAEGLPADAVHERIVKELVASVECPVIIAPASFEEIEEIVFWYNGSTSAAFAMKQFAYLFEVPEYVKATIAVAQNEEQTEIYDKHHITDWLSRYYDYGDVVMLKDHQEKGLFDYLLRKKKVMLVIGAHGRATLLRFFQQSLSDLQLKTLPFPLFITNH